MSQPIPSVKSAISVSNKNKKRRFRRIKQASKNQELQQKVTKTVCKIPHNLSEISANWNRLQNKISKFNKTNDVKKLNVSNDCKTVKDLKIECSQTKEHSKKGEIWFDDVDHCLVKSSMISSNKSENQLCKETSFNGLTRFVAMDCEMVGTGFDGNDSILARVSIVNLYGHCIYDKYVKPTEEVTDYRTEVSGIRPENLVNGEEFKLIQQEVYDIIRDRVLVGHSIQHDLKVLFLSQPKHMIRDTSVYFRRFFNNRTPSLKKLSDVYLGVQIQSGEHDSITDAQATMRLYTLFKKKWECSLKKKSKLKATTNTQTTDFVGKIVQD